MSHEVLSALEIVRAERKARGEAFRNRIIELVRPVCVEFKCNIPEFRVEILDIDVVIPTEPLEDIGGLPVQVTADSQVVI